jgi:hypothetical protein
MLDLIIYSILIVTLVVNHAYHARKNKELKEDADWWMARFTEAESELNALKSKKKPIFKKKTKSDEENK